MIQARAVFFSVELAALSGLTHAADSPGTSLLPADSVPEFKLSASAGENATMSVASVSGQPFAKALRIQVTRKPQRAADVLISAPVNAALASGDVLLLSFWMRSGTAAEATLDAGFRALPGTAAAPGAVPPAGRGPVGASGAGRGQGGAFG